jgi:hypothetical protein
VRRQSSIQIATLMLLVAFLLGHAGFTGLRTSDPWLIAGVALAAFLGGLAVSLIWPVDAVPASVLGYGLGVLVAAASGAVIAPRLGIPATIVLLVFGGGAMAALYLAADRMLRRGETVSVESNWGGLGHGMGGWQMSAPAALLLAALVLGVLAVAGAIVLKPPTEKDQPTKPEAHEWVDALPGAKPERSSR